MLGTGALIVAYGYGMEAFMAWVQRRPSMSGTHSSIVFGPGGYWWTYWLLILCNILIPQLLWSRKVRLNVLAVFFVSLVVNVGMWLERFVIVVTSLSRDFVPSSWGMYYPTVWDWSTYLGTIGLFLALMFLFIRVLPAISIFKMHEVVLHQRQRRLMSTEIREPQQLGGLYGLYGLMAEFDDPDELLQATWRARSEGYRVMDAYTPMPIEGLAEALDFRPDWVARIVFVAGCLGGLRRVRAVLVDLRDRLSAQCRGKAFE